MGSVIVTVDVDVQPFKSVTVTMHTPAHKLSAVAVISPLLHKYIYPGVPPFAVTVAVPSHKPLHVTFV